MMKTIQRMTECSLFCLFQLFVFIILLIYNSPDSALLIICKSKASTPRCKNFDEFLKYVIVSVYLGVLFHLLIGEINENIHLSC